jgi:cyclic pyranopterin monophosphate synthase
MLDVSAKNKSLRIASARARLHVSAATLVLIRERKIPKGDPFEVSKVAAVQAAKNTAAIIPYCHPLPVDFVGVSFELGETWIDVQTTVKAVYKTGVEMEALTAATVAALTLYDMLKMLDEAMSIGEVILLKKSGGKSDFTTHYARPLRAAVLVMSDSISAGKKDDASGKVIVERLQNEGVQVEEYLIIPDEKATIVSTLIRFADDLKVDCVLTTGGTGFSARDCTPEAMRDVIEREAPGISEAARLYGQERTPYSMLSRGKAGVRGRTLIVNLPGSRKGVADSLNALFPGLLHSFKMISGGNHD